MKYFSKEWSKTNDNIKLNFEICLDAENFSEEVFIETYNRELNKFLIANDYMGEDAEEVFEDFYNSYLKLFTKYFPKYILEKVADIRMLALKKVSPSNFYMIQEYADKKFRDYENITAEYLKEYIKIKDKLPKKIEDNFNLHDCLITNIVKEENKYIIELDCSSGFVDIKKIIFKDYKILEEEMKFINGWCLYQEIYIVDEEYEIHLMIDVPNKEDSNLGYLTIRAKDVVFE